MSSDQNNEMVWFPWAMGFVTGAIVVLILWVLDDCPVKWWRWW